MQKSPSDGRRKNAKYESDSDDEFAGMFDGFDMDAVYAIAAAASQKATARAIAELQLQGRGGIGSSLRESTPSPSKAFIMNNEDFDNGGHWVYDHASAGAAGPSGSQRREQGGAFASRDAKNARAGRRFNMY